MARRNSNALGVLIAGLVGLGLVLMVLRYTWPLLLAGSVGCLGAYLLQVYQERSATSQMSGHRDQQVNARRAQRATDELLAAAQPQSPNDTFATCPACAYTTFQMIFDQTEQGTTRRCVSCGHEWTINHEKQVS